MHIPPTHHSDVICSLTIYSPILVVAISFIYLIVVPITNTHTPVLIFVVTFCALSSVIELHSIQHHTEWY